jgi:hypothetical protein
LVARRSTLSIIALAVAGVFLAGTPEAQADEPDDEAPAESSNADRAQETERSSDAPRRSAPEAVVFDKWRGVSFGTYLAPTSDGFIGDDDGFDVVFHFHAGQMAERELRESGVNAVFVSCGFGIGSGAYSAAFASPERFQLMQDELVKSIESQTHRKNLHVRRLALASWSAGFAAVGRILSIERYYARVDTVILNDSLHSTYVGAPATALGADHVDLKMMAPFVRFAKDASEGRKAMTITHSAIVPPDYASSTEATEALLGAINVPTTTTPTNEQTPSPLYRGMTVSRHADHGNLHVLGFRGGGPRDHFQHLYLIGEALRSSLVPRWKPEETLGYTAAGEQP